MTSMNKEAVVLKSDGAGRVQTPVDRQIALVREYERSGLSGPRFAAMAGINYQTFVTWRRKHGLDSSAREQRRARPVSFLEAVISAGPGEEPAASSTAALVIELSSGVNIEPQEVQAAPEAWRCMGEEVTEQLDYEPAKFLRRRLIRRKYVKCDEAHQPRVTVLVRTPAPFIGEGLRQRHGDEAHGHLLFRPDLHFHDQGSSRGAAAAQFLQQVQRHTPGIMKHGAIAQAGEKEGLLFRDAGHGRQAVITQVAHDQVAGLQAGQDVLGSPLVHLGEGVKARVNEVAAEEVKSKLQPRRRRADLLVAGTGENLFEAGVKRQDGRVLDEDPGDARQAQGGGLGGGVEAFGQHAGKEAAGPFSDAFPEGLACHGILNVQTGNEGKLACGAALRAGGLGKGMKDGFWGDFARLTFDEAALQGQGGVGSQVKYINI